MRKKLLIFVFVLATMVFTVPAEGFAASSDPQGKSRSHGQDKNRNRGTIWEGGQNKGRHRYRGRNRTTYGYRNYGQYRRTQVGNRRYRMVRRSYWRDGIRLSRYVRVYY
jgi:hypothetical protein